MNLRVNKIVKLWLKKKLNYVGREEKIALLLGKWNELMDVSISSIPIYASDEPLSSATMVNFEPGTMTISPDKSNITVNYQSSTSEDEIFSTDPEDDANYIINEIKVGYFLLGVRSTSRRRSTSGQSI